MRCIKYLFLISRLLVTYFTGGVKGCSFFDPIHNQTDRKLTLLSMVLASAKKLLSSILLLLLSSKLCALTFTTEGCGETKGCYASPASCTTSENCNFLITYNATNSTHVEFELSGRGDWIAVGFSDDQLMVNTDILMCVNNQSLSGHYYATNRSRPPRTNPTPAAVQFIEQADENNTIKCRVSRDINPDPPIQNFKDLNQEVFLLAAYGNVTGSGIQQHSNRAASPQKVVVTQANSTIIPQVNTNTSAPAMQQGSFRFPDNCPDADCHFLVTYQASGNNSVVFELRGRGNWAGVGFSDDNQMPDTDILICASDTLLSGHYYATSRTTPNRTDPTPSAVEITNQTFNGSVVSCRITRELDPGIANFRNLRQDWFLLGAIGDLSGATIGIHSVRRASSSRINLLTSEVGSGGTVTPTSFSSTEAPTIQQGSFRFPDNCPDADCDFLVTYQASGANGVVFELRGRGNWAGVGFSEDNQMPDTDILICASDTSLSGHYYACGRTRPTRTDPTPLAVEIADQSFNGGVVSCRITRDVNPGLGNFRNLEDQQFLLGAIGGLSASGATIELHSARRASSSRINVRTGEVGSGATVMPTSSSSTEAPTMQQGSFRFPDNCPDADCDFLVTYQASGDNSVVFELRGRGNWAGVGFSEDNQMPDTDILICASDTSLSGHYYATGRSEPARTNPTPLAVEIAEQSFNGGVVSCRITREVNPAGLENFRNLEEQQFLLGAIGSLSGATIGIHSARRASASRIDVRSGANAAGNDAIEAMVLAHGILMTLAWLLFAFVGLFTARYMRQVWEPTKLLGEKAWFTVHRTLMIITLLLTITGTIVIFVFIDGYSSSAQPHPSLGIVTIALALIQPIMAAFRPHPGEPKREIFNWCHRIVGIGALVMAIVTIDYGLATEKVGLGKEGFRAIIAFIIGIGLIIIFEFYLFITKINKEKRTVSSNNSRDIQMEPTGQQTAQPHPKMSIKEAMLRSLMFTFVVLLGAAVALTIILLMVLK